MADTSQKGDWDNMRNETLDGEPYDFDEAKVNSGGLPKHGTLEFDYVSTDARFRQVCYIVLHCVTLCYTVALS